MELMTSLVHVQLAGQVGKLGTPLPEPQQTTAVPAPLPFFPHSVCVEKGQRAIMKFPVVCLGV